MEYEAPEIKDYGDLIELTRASGLLGTEDGAGKVTRVAIDPLQITLQVLP